MGAPEGGEIVTVPDPNPALGTTTVADENEDDGDEGAGGGEVDPKKKKKKKKAAKKDDDTVPAPSGAAPKKKGGLGALKAFMEEKKRIEEEAKRKEEEERRRIEEEERRAEEEASRKEEEKQRRKEKEKVCSLFLSSPFLGLTVTFYPGQARTCEERGSATYEKAKGGKTDGRASQASSFGFRGPDRGFAASFRIWSAGWKEDRLWQSQKERSNSEGRFPSARIASKITRAEL